jgi:predicted transcriptional regulator of viral defense system
MKGYQELAEKMIFNFNDALNVYKNKATAYGALSRLEKQGFIKKVRNNLYVSINPVTQTAFANKYQIGTSINDDAYISHISALEYYGYQNQVSHICTVSSSKRFNSFEFEGITFKQVAIKSRKGVFSPPYTQMLKITDIEKTVIDSIQTIGSIINLEELIYSLELIPKLDEKKLIEYLEAYNTQALYQKSGYLLSLFNDTLKLNESFFEWAKKKMNQSVVYLSEDAKQDGAFIKAYQVVVPTWLIERGQSYEI